MLFAVEEGSGFEDLRGVVKAYVDQGLSILVIMEDLEQIRGLLSETQEDDVLDVMDLVVGYCRPRYASARTPGAIPATNTDTASITVTDLSSPTTRERDERERGSRAR